MQSRGGESVASPETLSSPETIDHAAALRELFTFDDAFIAEQRQALQTSAERLASTVINPDQQIAIGLWTNIIDWHMFGKHGDPLPTGVINTTNEKGETCFAVDDTIPYINLTLDALGKQRGKIGLDKVGQAMREILDDREPAIKSVIKDYLMQTHSYRTLSSFETIQRQPDDMPLSPFMKIVHLAAATGEVADKYGPGPYQRRDAPDRHLAGRKNQIDEMQAHASPQTPQNQ